MKKQKQAEVKLPQRIAETGQEVSYGNTGEPVKVVTDNTDGSKSESILTDGLYTLQDGTIITVKHGLLVDVETPEEEDIEQDIPNEQVTMSKKEKLGANAYEPTGNPKPFTPEAPPTKGETKMGEGGNDTVPSGAANNGSGLVVDPVKSIGTQGGAPKKRKLKTTRMRMKDLIKNNDKSSETVPATPIQVDKDGQPKLPDTEKKNEISKTEATPTVKLNSAYERAKYRFEKFGEIVFGETQKPNGDSKVNPVNEKADKSIANMELEPNKGIADNKGTEGKGQEAPTTTVPAEPLPATNVMKPSTEETDKKPKSAVPPVEEKAALPPDIVDEDESPEDSQAENEQELPLTDMDKTVRDLITGKGDGQYNIMVLVEGGQITEAGMEMELEQSMSFAKTDDSVIKGKGNKKHNKYKIKFKKLQKKNEELMNKFAEMEAKLQAPIAKPDFGNEPKQEKQNFTEEQWKKMSTYEKFAIKNGFRLIK